MLCELLKHEEYRDLEALTSTKIGASEERSEIEASIKELHYETAETKPHYTHMVNEVLEVYKRNEKIWSELFSERSYELEEQPEYYTAEEATFKPQPVMDEQEAKGITQRMVFMSSWFASIARSPTWEEQRQYEEWKMQPGNTLLSFVFYDKTFSMDVEYLAL